MRRGREDGGQASVELALGGASSGIPYPAPGDGGSLVSCSRQYPEALNVEGLVRDDAEILVTTTDGLQLSVPLQRP